jgi:hypothetical protein
MNKNDADFKQWQPEPGSQLWQAIEARQAAENECIILRGAIDDLQRQRQAAQAAVDAITWRDTNVDEIAAKIASLPIFNEMIRLAQDELKTAEHKRVKAAKQVSNATGNLSASLKAVKQYEQLMIDVPGRVTEVDHKRHEAAEHELARLSAVLLA